MIDHLSPSQISLYEQCPLAYKYTYIDKLPKPPAPPQVAKGSLLHSVIYEKIKNREYSAKDYIDKVKDIPELKLYELKQQDREAVLASAVKAAEVIDKLEWLPQEPIELVETNLEFNLDGINMVVKPDLVTTNSVYDHKVITANALFRYERMRYPDQLIIGAMATNKPRGAFNLFIELNDGSYAYKKIEFDGLKFKFKRTFTKIKTIWYLINNNIFYPVDKDGGHGWKCSPKFCDWYNQCEFGAADEIPPIENNIVLF